MNIIKKSILLIFVFSFTILKTIAKEPINIAYTIDNKYYMYTLISISSMLKHNKSNSDYHFYIIENNLSNKNKNIMKWYVKSKHQNITIIHFDTKVIDGGTHFYQYQWLARISRIAMARIMLPDILPETVKRVIYLDADTLPQIDFKELFETDLGKYPAAMVLDRPDNMETPLYKFKNGYYNSGIILMDLNKWRKYKISNKLLSYLKKHKQLFISDPFIIYNTKFLFADQDLLNIILDGQIKPLHPKWNNQVDYNYIKKDFKIGYFYLFSINWKEDSLAIPKTSPQVLHYIGGNKPWLYIIGDYPAVRTYLNYWITSDLWMFRPYFLVFLFVEKYQKILSIKHSRIVNTLHIVGDYKK